MVAPLRSLQNLVLSNDLSNSKNDGDGFLARVQNAIKSAYADPGAVGPSDIAALLRQAVLRCHLTFGEHAELRVPRRVGWPDEVTWKRFTCEVRQAGEQYFLIRPQRWAPEWLDSGAATVVEASIREESRRVSRPVRIDPVVGDCTGYTDYFSPGQRAAVQAAFLAPAGSTIIINLPTGAGKTLAFQAPALVSAREMGLTLVVVPTVALAKDQESRFRALQSRQPATLSQSPLAYHSGLDDRSKAQVRDAIRRGTQNILFASPEAVTGSLRDALFESARQGLLRIFVVDEAHIVSQWGQQFRPEFQSLSGIRDALLGQCPPGRQFRTLLLTGTFTAECYETLRYLFASSGCQIVSEVELRPEPGYLIRSDMTEIDKFEHVLEAIRHLPRPLILYTTLREHAEQWFVGLRQAGHRRLQLVRGGDLSQDISDATLEAWRNKQLDLVVATSAFGLGVDQADVRSVVHACLPETVDRYYQEVGRAGRDGKAAVALLVTAPADELTAERLTQEKIISVDRGFERWEAMWFRRKYVDDDMYVVSLSDRPADILDDSETNQAWNLRILVLMARAGLIRFSAHEPPRMMREDFADDAEFEARLRNAFIRFSKEVAIQVCDARHSDKTHWNNVVSKARRMIHETDARAIALVRELRDLQRPLNDIFREVYSLTDPRIEPPRLTGSCPITRRRNTHNFFSGEPELTVLSDAATRVADTFESALSPSLDSAGRWWIAYEPVSGGDGRHARELRDRASTLLRHAVSAGILEIAAPDEFLGKREWAQLSARTPSRFLIRSRVFPEENEPPIVPVPRMTIVAATEIGQLNIASIMRLNRPRHLIVLPKNVVDPIKPFRHLFDVVRHLSIDDALLRLAS